MEAVILRQLENDIERLRHTIDYQNTRISKLEEEVQLLKGVLKGTILEQIYDNNRIGTTVDKHKE